MKSAKSFFRAIFILSLMLIPMKPAKGQIEAVDLEEEGTVLVGRISFMEGQVLCYVPEEEDWVAAVEDAPFGVDDLLYASSNGRAEMVMPNNTWIRIDRDTQIQLLVLQAETTKVDLGSGKARLYNKSSEAKILATTPYGSVMAPGGAVFDLYVGEHAVEVMALKGTVDFLHDASDKRYEVKAGSSSIFADGVHVTASKGQINSIWDAWNRDRDALWADRIQAKGGSASYLHPYLHDEAYILERYGRWERVFYDDAYYYFWRPTLVNVGWAPFTVGRWTVWHGESIWIPYEPFGYVTHHYGNWMFIRGFWYWAPPVTRVRVYAGPPLLNIGFGWYPGRVAWIHFGAHLGWIPLGPHEPYYCHRYWGRRSIVVAHVNTSHFHHSPGRYMYGRHAVIIHRDHLYSGKRYNQVRLKNIPYSTVTQNYRTMHDINDGMIKSHRTMGKRYDFTDVQVGRKPPLSVTQNMKQRRLVPRQPAADPKERVQKNTKTMEEGRILQDSWKKSSKKIDGVRHVKQESASRPNPQMPTRKPEKKERHSKPVNSQLVRREMKEMPRKEVKNHSMKRPNTSERKERNGYPAARMNKKPEKGALKSDRQLQPRQPRLKSNETKSNRGSRVSSDRRANSRR